ncbi:hypothetical protein BTVI_10968 [Pitangus sulphuratus]|nr:hypothetical protein BTVI_10968 [Pitangus sulphuratus]
MDLMDGLLSEQEIEWMVTFNYGLTSSWGLVTSGIPQGFIWGPALFSIFINDRDSRIKCTLNKFADDIKPSDTANMPEGQDAIQRNPDKLKNPISGLAQIEIFEVAVNVDWSQLTEQRGPFPVLFFPGRANETGHGLILSC